MLKQSLTLFFICCFWLFQNNVLAQKKSVKKSIITHIVEPQQTIFSIANQYNISTDVLKETNGLKSNSIKVGQALKVPITNDAKTLAKLPQDTSKYIYHKVLKNQNLLSISKSFGVSVSSILKLNPQLKTSKLEGLRIIIAEKKSKKRNQTVQINDTLIYTPTQTESVYELSKRLRVSLFTLLKLNPNLSTYAYKNAAIKFITNTSYVDEDSIAQKTILDSVLNFKPKKSNYKVGLFLPFNTSIADTLSVDYLVQSETPFPYETTAAIDFYAGIKESLLSLSSTESTIDLQLYDAADSTSINNILNLTEIKILDVIIGPFNYKDFRMVSAKAKELKIPIISPTTISNKIISDNNLVSKVTPSHQIYIEGLANYFKNTLKPNSTVFILNLINQKDMLFAQTFSNAIQTPTLIVKQVGSFSVLKNMLSESTTNVVALFTSNNVLLQDYLTQLATATNNQQVIAVGFNNIINNDNIDLEYLNKLQYHYASNLYLNEHAHQTNTLQKAYQTQFNTIPTDNYYLGYDIGHFYFNNLILQGPSFFNALHKYKDTGLITNFDFLSINPSTGYENMKFHVFKYQNHSIIKIQ